MRHRAWLHAAIWANPDEVSIQSHPETYIGYRQEQHQAAKSRAQMQIRANIDFTTRRRCQ